MSMYNVMVKLMLVTKMPMLRRAEADAFLARLRHK